MSTSPSSPALSRTDLVPAQAGTGYACPMHPEVRSAQAGTCPKCGMALEAERPVNASNGGAHQRRFTIGAYVFLGVIAFYLWTEHRAHLLGALPYLIALLCPAMHFFMHRGHRHDGSSSAHEH
ncbi:MAG TPA: DUF2933 domain-containing protein [Polyangiaceae bacterium]|nr:DUF2933 domain-containing protein [Polyangiaceae bacterium]